MGVFLSKRGPNDVSALSTRITTALASRFSFVAYDASVSQLRSSIQEHETYTCAFVFDIVGSLFGRAYGPASICGQGGQAPLRPRQY